MTKSLASPFLLLAILILTSCISCKEARIPSWTEMESPTGKDSETPNLHQGADGTIYLSWIEWTPDTASIFYFSTFSGNSWSAKKEIARGKDWFVNWADFASLTVFLDHKYLAAHWLQKSAKGKYDYNVMVSLSDDGGESWKAPFVLHQDSVPAEHGFVSSVRDLDQLFFCWLDGRNMAGQDHGSVHDAHHGAMTLRGVWMDIHGNTSGEHELDTMICECCQTSVVKTNRGLVISYRDRSEMEIRDIAHIRWDGISWSAPEIAVPDHWRIAGCPVNGPAMSHVGDTLYRAWYGVKDSMVHVSYITSKNAGADWSEPVLLDNQAPLGRVDIASDHQHVWVSWIGKDEQDSTWIKVATIDPFLNNFHIEPVAWIDPSRRSGFPVLTHSDYGLIIAYTAIEGTLTKIKIKRNKRY